MIKLSYWARDHRSMARILLIGCFLLLYATGLFAGAQLRALSIQFGIYFLIAVIVAYACFYFYYPYTKARETLGKNRYYQRIRTARIGLTVCLFALILFAGNRPEKVQPFSLVISEAKAILPAKDSPSVKYWTASEFRAQMKDANGKKLKLKERKNLLKKQLTAIQESSESNGSKALLIALSVIVALGAGFGILALSCSLSCGGQGGLAAVVLIGGTTLIVFGLIKIIRHITRPKPEPN